MELVFERELKVVIHNGMSPGEIAHLLGATPEELAAWERKDAEAGREEIIDFGLAE